VHVVRTKINIIRIVHCLFSAVAELFVGKLGIAYRERIFIYLPAKIIDVELVGRLLCMPDVILQLCHLVLE